MCSPVEGGISAPLLEWYAHQARAMPWRVPPGEHAAGVRANPYHVWLSEVMLQQTQVVTVESYFLNFVALWPTLKDLAQAPLEPVLQAWAGLGYYSRARNLKKCAEIVWSEYNGHLPESARELQKLPGIGPYTAAAIASIAFDEPVAVVDGNIERVISRVLSIETPLPAAKPEIASAVEQLMDQEKPGEFAQALMDLGATICTPRNPNCTICPLTDRCWAFEIGDTTRFPVKLPKKPKPVRKGAAFVILNKRGNVLLEKRPGTGLLAGMSAVPTSNWTSREDGETGERAAPFLASWTDCGEVQHTFTHFHLHLEVWRTQASDDRKLGGWWVRTDALDREALPKVFTKAITKALECQPDE